MAAAQKATSLMQSVFPESHLTLKVADPEVFGIIENEKERQWCASVPVIFVALGIELYMTPRCTEVFGRKIATNL